MTTHSPFLSKLRFDYPDELSSSKIKEVHATILFSVIFYGNKGVSMIST
jgi:hypothetical protein